MQEKSAKNAEKALVLIRAQRADTLVRSEGAGHDA